MTLGTTKAIQHRYGRVLLGGLVVLSGFAHQDAPTVRLSEASANAVVTRSGAIRDAGGLDPIVMLVGGGVAVQRQAPTTIEIFSSEGRLSGTIPSRGDPVFFAERAPMALLRPDTLVVFDGRGRRLVFYQIGGPHPRYVGMETTEHNYTDICAINGSLLLYRPVGGGSVDIKDSRDTRPTRVLVESVGPVRPPIQQLLNDGRLVCDSKHREFTLVGMHSPDIRRYDLQGRMMWHRRLPGYRYIDAQSPTQNTFTMAVPAGGYHRLMRASHAADTALIVQLGLIDSSRVRWGGRRPPITHVFAARTGRPLKSEISAEILAAEGNTVWALAGSGLHLTRHHLVTSQQRK